LIAFPKFFLIGPPPFVWRRGILECLQDDRLPESNLTGAAEQLRHEGCTALLGEAALGLLALGQLGHDFAGLRDLEEGFDERLLVAGEAAVFEGVKVALGCAGAGAASAPAALSFPGSRGTASCRFRLRVVAGVILHHIILLPLTPTLLETLAISKREMSLGPVKRNGVDIGRRYVV
jgi:hypothetical protein